MLLYIQIAVPVFFVAKTEVSPQTGVKMLSFGRKAILFLPKWTWKNAQTLKWASSSSIIKLPSIFGSKTEVSEKSKISQQGTPGKIEYFVPRKFVPMTRKALIRRIVEDGILVNTSDRHYFQGLADLLDKSTAGSFHGALGELKAGQVFMNIAMN